MNLAKRHFGEALQYDPDHKVARAEFKKVKNLQKRKQQVEPIHNSPCRVTTVPHKPLQTLCMHLNCAGKPGREMQGIWRVLGGADASPLTAKLARLQAEEAMAKGDWALAEHHYIDALWIDEAAVLINTALWLGRARPSTT